MADILKNYLIHMNKLGSSKVSQMDSHHIEKAIDRLNSSGLIERIEKGMYIHNSNDDLIGLKMEINKVVNDYSLLLKNLKLINNDSDYYLKLIEAEKSPIRKLKLLFQLIVEHNVG